MQNHVLSTDLEIPICCAAHIDDSIDSQILLRNEGISNVYEILFQLPEFPTIVITNVSFVLTRRCLRCRLIAMFAQHLH